MDTNPHASSLVQAGLAGLMNLSADNNLLNAAVAAVAASRAEEVGGEQVGAVAGGWGVLGVGMGSAMDSGGYSITGGGEGGGSSGGPVDGGGN